MHRCISQKCADYSMHIDSTSAIFTRHGRNEKAPPKWLRFPCRYALLFSPSTLGARRVFRRTRNSNVERRTRWEKSAASDFDFWHYCEVFSRQCCKLESRFNECIVIFSRNRKGWEYFLKWDAFCKPANTTIRVFLIQFNIIIRQMKRWFWNKVK